MFYSMKEYFKPMIIVVFPVRSVTCLTHYSFPAPLCDVAPTQTADPPESGGGTAEGEMPVP